MVFGDWLILKIVMDFDKLRDRFRGALVGTFVGDALGAPLEGMSAGQIRRRHGGEVRDMRKKPMRLSLQYSCGGIGS